MRMMFYEIMAAIGQSAQYGHIQRLGHGLGWLIWTAVPSRRRLAVTTIQERLGVDRAKATTVARESFTQNGRSFLEVLFCRKVDWRFRKDRVMIESPERLQEILNQMRDRAFVAATAHLGAWELLGGLLHLMAPQEHKQVIVKPTHDRCLYRVIRRLRSHPTVRIIEHEQAVPKVLHNLKQKGLSAFLVDHNCRREEAVFLPFLGLKAAVNVGPALLALRAKALVWPVFLIREDPDHYRLLFEDPLDTTKLSGDRHEQLHAVAAFYTQAVEVMVRRYPEQWFWMHRRWKTRPTEDLGT
ncbi:MAG: acyltransferase [Desulfovibrionales bacterium]|nr:MAG: acyltransferase [Desulfovibrionales bacterium]